MSPIPVRRRSWSIDVCRTCDRVATWPFCEHRNQPPPPGATSWLTSITVVPWRKVDRTTTSTAKPDRPPVGPSGVSPGPGGTR